MQPKRGIAVLLPQYRHGGRLMNSIVYLVGLVVIVIAILSFVGLR
jgi:hypothetical protein